MEIVNDLLGVPGLKIIQDSDLFSFSIDSILLANFVTLRYNVKEIMDLGTGNAPIPLYLTLRTKAHITGVEIQTKSYDLAKKSVKINHKEDQISLLLKDMKELPKEVTVEKMDVVTCNPPFFKVSSLSNVNDSDYKTIARHEVCATLDDVCQVAFKMLKNMGIFAMVHRPDRLVDVIETLRRNHLEPKRLRFIYPKQGLKANHILIEAIKNGSEGGLKILSPLYVHTKDNHHTAEVRKIYNGTKEW